jgi:hypothetical protein
MDASAESHQDSKGRFTHSAVEAVTGVQIPIEMLAELRMSAATMSAAVKRITDVANLDESGARALLTHGFMREANGERPTVESLAAEAAEIFGAAKAVRDSGARQKRGKKTGAGMQMVPMPAVSTQRIGLAQSSGAGFDFGAFLRNAGKAAKVVSAAAAAAPAVIDAGRRFAGRGLDVGGLDVGGLDVGGLDRGALMAAQQAALRRGAGLLGMRSAVVGAGGLMLGGQKKRM